jgi:hypothetical protein
VRTFETGATRDSDTSKPDYEGFLSPLAVERYGQYMVKHQRQADGNLRASDNWQKGIPKDAYMKSAFRHFVDFWRLHREGRGESPDAQEAQCALLFNVMGYLHETIKGETPKEIEGPDPCALDTHPFISGGHFHCLTCARPEPFTVSEVQTMFDGRTFVVDTEGGTHLINDCARVS